jgi:glycosyltransferase involved in cell wall biosynthesis
MSKLRIAHAIRSLDPAMGGPVVVCRQMATAQSRLGHTAVVLAEVESTRGEAVSGVSVRILGRTHSGERFWGGPITRTLRTLVEEFDILHLHGVWDNFLQVFAATAQRAKVPYIVMPHGMLDPWSMSQKPWKKRLALALGTRKMLSQASALHLLYREEGEYARELGVPTRGEVIPNGVTLEEIEPIPLVGEFRETAPELGDHPYVLFLGRLHHKKGLDFLADAFALLAGRFPEAHLVVAGTDDGAKLAFVSQIARLGLNERVHLVGPIYGAYKWAALARAACFCLPSRQEGFSVAILEALACRCPVVISDQCHFPEVVERGAGIVVSLDPAAIATGLEEVLVDPARAARMGYCGRELIEKHYTWDHVAENTIRLYSMCMKKNQS